jgi:hypothetical protein
MTNTVLRFVSIVFPKDNWSYTLFAPNPSVPLTLHREKNCPWYARGEPNMKQPLHERHAPVL